MCTIRVLASESRRPNGSSTSTISSPKAQPARTEVGRAAEQNLREAVHEYDNTHANNVWTVIESDVNTAEHALPAPPEQAASDTEMLVALAKILENMARHRKDQIFA